MDALHHTGRPKRVEMIILPSLSGWSLLIPVETTSAKTNHVLSPFLRLRLRNYVRSTESAEVTAGPVNYIAGLARLRNKHSSCELRRLC